jgi:putative transposase
MRPGREQYASSQYAYFVSTQTWSRRALFRNERWATLMCQTLDHYNGSGYALHAFVVMPDHLHFLITPNESLEKSVQLVKGGFSFRAKRELQSNMEIWQPGFTDHRIRDEEDWQNHLKYIRLNPVNAKLVEDSAPYPFMSFLDKDFPPGLKPQIPEQSDVQAKARTLHPVSDQVRRY